MKKTKWLFVSSMISVVAIFLMLSPYRLSSQQGAVVRVDGDDIGGVVTSVNGPEAGVWVIAETTDLPTKFAKIVVTDDQGRYVHSRSAESQLQHVGARLRARRFAEGRRPRPARSLNLKAVLRRRCRGGGRILSGDLLVFDAQDSGQERISRHRAQRQRHAGKREKPGPVARRQSRPTAAYTCHQLGNKATRTIAERVRRHSNPRPTAWAAAHSVRPGHDEDGQRHWQARHAARA